MQDDLGPVHRGFDPLALEQITGHVLDTVQDAWLRLSRGGADGVENLGAWLAMVVARVRLNMLRSRERRREEPLDAHVPDPIIGSESRAGPERLEKLDLTILDR